MSNLVKYEHEDYGNRGLRPISPAIEIAVRLAVQTDFDWIDKLQKSESDKVGFMWEQAIRKRIDESNVIICEVPGAGDPAAVQPAGYCLGVDRYLKRGDVGIIYQVCVMPQFRRTLAAATLLQAQFDKSAYGTKLYCCWCKQSLEANHFWEAMGFVPLAFRAGGRSGKKGDAPKVHAFWQKRVRAGDTETPYWYPYETTGGAMMEGRVVLPLPPEVQWSDATPVILPGAERRANESRMLEYQLKEVEK